MAYGTNTVAGGSTGSLPDIPVYGDTAGGGVIQGVKEIDPTAGSTTPIGTDANPKKVKPRRWGTADYDSGRVAVNSPAPATVTIATVYPERIAAVNTSNAVRKITLTDLSDNVRAVMLIPPDSTVPIPCAGAWPGLKAGADGTGVVVMIDGGQ